MSEPPIALAEAIEASREGKMAIHLVLVTHPAWNFIFQTQPKPGVSKANSSASDPYLAWRGEEAAWVGAALWAHPRGLDAGLMSAKAGCLSSHVHPNASSRHLDEAFNLRLGPWGCSISGSSSNPSAFQADHFPAPLSITHCETREGGSFPAEGEPRPPYWPEPFPLQRFNWTRNSPPNQSPDFAAAALATASLIRQQALQALREEGYDDELTEPLRGGLISVPSRMALHFLRQDHPMFGASRLEERERSEALALFDLARGAFEMERIAKATGPGSQNSKPPRM